MKTKSYTPIRADWWTKSILGAVLSLILAVGLSNVMVILLKPYIAINVLAQLGMWGIAWLWLPIFFGCFYFSKGWHMVLSMSTVISLVYSLLFWLRG